MGVPPKGALVPGTHGVHSAAPEPGCCSPGSHGVHCTAPREGATLPGAHAAHAVAPLALCALPMAQRSHAGKPVVDAKKPGRHAVGADAPDGHSEPAGHGSHCDASNRFSTPLCVPAGHGTALVEPSGQ